MNARKEEQEELEAEEYMNTNMAEYVKVKVRAAYKENKSKQRFLPVGSRLK